MVNESQVGIQLEFAAEAGKTVPPHNDRVFVTIAEVQR